MLQIEKQEIGKTKDLSAPLRTRNRSLYPQLPETEEGETSRFRVII
jgi:hypothetical protein